eukprot:CAMPEP_0171855234 /NCGR_PEP_ID=MMETSP0992-20121227/23355_1 /TAXON_ID=483369 /ORGANISM="non described non described, Strain CCMP2098" /LENGTH=55 /DNA_ID=CAMNT_0012476005 /DNA_START=807 /DNA_END=971 /DNA_ORIENTATION=-
MTVLYPFAVKSYTSRTVAHAPKEKLVAMELAKAAVAEGGEMCVVFLGNKANLAVL